MTLPRIISLTFLFLTLALCSCGPFGVIPLGAIAAGGGGGGGGGDDAQPPPPDTFSVTPVKPAEDETGIDIYSPVEVVFSEPIDPSSVTSMTFSVGGNPGTYSFWDNNTRVIYRPSSPYSMWTTVTVSISNISSEAQPPIFVEPLTYSFTTGGSSTTPPEVVAWIPETGFEVPYQSYIPVRVLFSKPMNTATVTNSTFYIYGVGSGASLNGTVSWTPDFYEFTFTPTDVLEMDGEHEIRVASTVEDSGGIQMGSLFSSNFYTKDMQPDLVMIPASVDNVAGYITEATQYSVTVRVDINANVCSDDRIWVTLDDGNHPPIYEETQTGADGPASISITGIDASGLDDGAIALEAGILRSDFASESETGSATKDGSPPSVSLSSPLQIPMFYELRNLEVDMDIDSDCMLHMTGGRNNESVAVTAGTYQADYELKIAGVNDIDIYATDSAGNESNHITQMVIHRGGAGGNPVSGTMQVSVYYSSSLTPVPNAMVIRGYNTEVLYTDSEGMVTFEGGFSGPQAITVVHAGYPIFSILDVDADRISMPIVDEEFGPQSAMLQGSIAPTSGMVYSSQMLSWEGGDADISDGDFSLEVRPNRHITLSAIDLAGGGFNNFTYKQHLGPIAPNDTLVHDLSFPGISPTETRLDSGQVTLPPGFYLPDGAFWDRGGCLIMSRSRAESDRFLCGWGPLAVLPTGGGPFDYSAIQPGYYQTVTGEYWTLLYLNDIYGREVLAAKPFIHGDPLPDFMIPDMPVLVDPGKVGVVTSLTPTFQWYDTNDTGVNVLQILNKARDTLWILLVEGGSLSATLPRIPDYSPVKVMEHATPMAEMLWRVESYHISPGLDFTSFTTTEFHLGADYRTDSEWREFSLWNPTNTNGRIPEFGVAGTPLGSLTVTVVDMGTETPIQGATVFLGDDSAGAQVTDAFGQTVFNGISGPQKLTVCEHALIDSPVGPMPVDMMITFDRLDCGYATIPVFTDMDGEDFALYGEIHNLPTGNDGWVMTTDYHGSTFNVNTTGGVNDAFGNTSYDGPSPENYCLECEDRGQVMVVTGFYLVTVGDTIFQDAYFSEPFKAQPYDQPYYKRAPDMYFDQTNSPGIAPIRRVSDPSEMWMPPNLSAGSVIDSTNAIPWAQSADNPWQETMRLSIGQGVSSHDGADPPALYKYGITIADPPNIAVDGMGLDLQARGFNPDGITAWDSEIRLRNLVSYPRKYNATLPALPYPVDPVHEQTDVPIPINMTWENSLMGKQGIYMIMLSSFTADPFFWMLLTPIPDTGANVSLIIPTQPPAYDGPQPGVLHDFSIQATLVPGLDMFSWSGNVFDDYEQGRVEWKDGEFTTQP